MYHLIVTADAGPAPTACVWLTTSPLASSVTFNWAPPLPICTHLPHQSELHGKRCDCHNLIWFERQQELKAAHYELGILHEKVDEQTKAAIHFSKAASLGHDQAQEKLGSIKSNTPYHETSYSVENNNVISSLATFRESKQDELTVGERVSLKI